MKIFFFLIGLILLIFSGGYLFYPQVILKINEWAGEKVFNDKYILLYRRKIGTYLLVFAILLFFISFSL